MSAQDTRNLKKRYLTWFYKSAKEALDKIDRKFTQVEIDRFIIRELKGADNAKALEKFIAEFETYVGTKEKEGRALKGADTALKPEYEFLAMKLRAAEKAIVKELGARGLAEIKALYEKEMTERILKSIEH